MIMRVTNVERRESGLPTNCDSDGFQSDMIERTPLNWIRFREKGVGIPGFGPVSSVKI
jgi:hypothetical protein